MGARAARIAFFRLKTRFSDPIWKGPEQICRAAHRGSTACTNGTNIADRGQLKALDGMEGRSLAALDVPPSVTSGRAGWHGR